MDAKLQTIGQELKQRSALTARHLKYLGTRYVGLDFIRAEATGKKQQSNN